MFTEETYRKLVASSWYEGRRIGTSPFKLVNLKDGYTWAYDYITECQVVAQVIVI